MRKVHVPRVRRRVRAFRHVADVAQIALVDDFHEIFFVDAVHFERFRFVDQIEQCREAVAQTDATTATMANVVDALQLFVQRFFVEKVWIFPVDDVTRRCLKIAFLCHDFFQ